MFLGRSRSFASPLLKTLLFFCALAPVLLFAQTTPRETNSRLLTIEGRVEVLRSGTATWLGAETNQLLTPGDRVRTGARGRAPIRPPNLSVRGVTDLTALEIRPPQTSAAAGSFEL